MKEGKERGKEVLEGMVVATGKKVLGVVIAVARVVIAMVMAVVMVDEYEKAEVI